MARAVPQRKQIPYLLIVFVFLFVIAAVLAIICYTEMEEQTLTIAALEQKQDSLATDGQLNEADVVALIDMFRDPEPGQTPVRVIPRLQNRIKELTQAITGQNLSFDSTTKAINDLQQQIASAESLIATIKRLTADETDLQAQLAQTRGELALARDEIGDVTNQKDESVASLNNEITQLRAQITQLGQQRQEALTDYSGQLEEIRETFAQSRRALDQQIAVLTQDLSRSVASGTYLQAEVARWKLLYTEILRRKLEGAIIVAPDGKIIEIGDDGIVYINIGEANNVISGLTFSIYPVTGMTRDNEKARLLVTRVHENTSECHITFTQNEQHPPSVDDLILNIAFDENRPHTFVVEGQFDLHGAGMATSEGADEVRSLIRRFNGMVTDAVVPGTDFVVMGDPPDKPMTPDNNDPQQVWHVYNEQMAIWEAYSRVSQEADALNIPILNTNRFLALTGYYPVETLRHNDE